MAQTVGALDIQIAADIAKLQTGLRQADRRIRNFQQRTNSELGKVERRFGSLGASLKGGLGGLVGGIAVGALARDIYQTGARVQDLQKRLETLTGSSQAAAESWDYLRDAANRLSVDVLGLTDSYSKLLPLVQAGLLTTAQARDILEGYGDVAAATGADTNQLAQSMYGLSQGLSAGTLRAEELNQVVEPLPGLLNALDRASGVGAGGFRKLVNAGEVTSAMFRDVLIKALKDYEGAAEDAADNASKAATRLNNAWIDLKASLADIILPSLAEGFEILAMSAEGWRRAIDAAKVWAQGSPTGDMESLSAEYAKQKSLLADMEATVARIRQGGGYVDPLYDKQIDIARKKVAALEVAYQRAADAYRDSQPAAPAAEGGAPPPAPVDEKRAEKIAKVVEALKFEREQLQRTSREQAIYNALKQAGVQDGDAEASKIRNLAGALYDHAEASEAMVAAAKQEQEARAELDDLLESTKQETALMKLSDAQREKRVALLRAEAIAKKAGIDLTPDYAAALEGEIEAQQNWTEQTRQQQAIYAELEQFGTRAFDRIGSALTEMAVNGEDAFGSLRNIGKAVLSELMQEFVKLAFLNPLKNTMFGGSSGWQSLPTLSGMFGGFFADGGRPPMGKLSVVGERGPELFVPDSAGTIIPNDMVGGVQRVALTVSLSEDLEATMQSTARNVSLQVVKANNRQVPGIVANAQKRSG